MASQAVLAVVALFFSTVAPAAVKQEQIQLQMEDVSPLYNEVQNSNLIVDMTLKHLINRLEAEGKSTIKLDDFNRGFSLKLFSKSVIGVFEATNGSFKNPTSIYRTGHATMQKIDSDTIITARIGFDGIEMEYNSFDIYVMDLHRNGSIETQVYENSLVFTIRIHHETNTSIPKCSVTLTNFKIETFDNIQVDIFDLGIFNNLENKIKSWLESHLTKWFRSYVETVVYPKMAQVVDTMDLCNLLPNV